MFVYFLRGRLLACINVTITIRIIAHLSDLEQLHPGATSHGSVYRGRDITARGDDIDRNSVCWGGGGGIVSGAQFGEGLFSGLLYNRNRVGRSGVLSMGFNTIQEPC
jgi:hypothetical protein